MMLIDRVMTTSCPSLKNCYSQNKKIEYKKNIPFSLKIIKVKNRSFPKIENETKTILLEKKKNENLTLEKINFYKKIKKISNETYLRNNKIIKIFFNKKTNKVNESQCYNEVYKNINNLTRKILSKNNFSLFNKNIDLNKLIFFLNTYALSKERAYVFNEKKSRLEKIKSDIKSSEILKKYITIENNIITSVHKESKISKRDLFLIYNEFIKNHSNRNEFVKNFDDFIDKNYNFKKYEIKNYNIMEKKAKEAAQLCEKWIIHQYNTEDFSNQFMSLVKKSSIQSILSEIPSHNMRLYGIPNEIQYKRFTKFPYQIKIISNLKKSEDENNLVLEKIIDFMNLHKINTEYVISMIHAISDYTILNLKKYILEKSLKKNNIYSHLYNDENKINETIDIMYNIIKKELVLSTMNHIFLSDEKLIKKICNIIKMYKINEEYSHHKVVKKISNFNIKLSNLKFLIDKVIDSINNRENNFNIFIRKIYEKNDVELIEIDLKNKKFAFEKIQLVLNATICTLEQSFKKYKNKDITSEINFKVNLILEDSKKGKILLELIKNYSNELLSLKSFILYLKEIGKNYFIVSEELNLISNEINSKEINEKVKDFIEKTYKSLPKKRSRWFYIKTFFQKNKKTLIVKMSFLHFFGSIIQFFSKLFSFHSIKPFGYFAHVTGLLQIIKGIHDAWCYANKERHELNVIYKEFKILKEKWHTIEP